MKDEYFDTPLNELVFVINGVKEVEETEHLKVAKATMYISADFHNLNCVGVYDVTDIIRAHKGLKLLNFALTHTIENKYTTVDVVVEWEE